jgi:hypothetical protein
MVKAAVLSALAFTSLKPIAVVSGLSSHNSSIVRWLICKGVRVIFHEPHWVKAVRQGQRHALELGLDRTASPLYKDWKKMVATFLRIDLPTLGFVDDYILYADVDVVFAHDVRTTHFGTMMPKYFTLGAEDIKNDTSGNMGVMLINVKNMRRKYAELVQWTFSEDKQQHGLHYGQPCDQGALKVFFERSFQVLHEPLFNWKPYWGFSWNAAIIHFHGPKPADYTQFLQKKKVPQIYEKLFASCNRSSSCGWGVQLYMNWSMTDLRVCQ